MVDSQMADVVPHQFEVYSSLLVSKCDYCKRSAWGITGGLMRCKGALAFVCNIVF